MDAFRRFRSSKKSKDQADVFTTFGDAESSYRSGSSPWQGSSVKSPTSFTRPSDTGTDRKVSHDQFRQPLFPVSQNRPGTAGRTQPLVLGIPKSFTNFRPGTADSMQRALDRAADSVKHTQSTTSRSPQALRSAQKPTRYVDIFAISEQPPRPSGTYNEDIAARNLDIVALNIESEHYRYEPGSKYQEEVAARNAYMSPPRYVSQARRPSTSERQESVDEQPSLVQSTPYAHQNQGKDSRRLDRTIESGIYYSRQSTSHAREARDHLPAIPQERSSEDFGVIRDIHSSATQRDIRDGTTQSQFADARRQRPLEYPPNVEKPLPASPQQKDGYRDSGISSYTNNTKRTSGTSDQSNLHLARGASLAGSVQGQRKPGIRDQPSYVVATPPQQVIPNLQEYRSERTSDGSRQYERLRPPSNTSSASAYKRVVVGSRTIMDLTGEEEPDAGSVVSFMPTPVIEKARFDHVERVVPTIVNHSPPARVEETVRELVVPNSRWSSAQEPVLDLDQLARRSQAISEAARALNAPNPVPVPLPPTRVEVPRSSPAPVLTFSTVKTWTSAPPSRIITFSPISTLTSTSPRNSTDLDGSVQQINRMTDNGIHGLNNKPVSSLNVKNMPSQRLSANIAPLVRIFADVEPDAAQSIVNLEKKEQVKPELNRKISSDQSVSSKKRGKTRERFEEAETIRQAARSIIPAGPIDQELVPGVKTRDFAAVPVEKPTNKRVEALTERKKSSESRPSKDQAGSGKSSSSSEKKSRLKPSRSTSKVAFNDALSIAPTSAQPTEKRSEKKSSKKSSKSGLNKSRQTRPKSAFDEDAFQRKHAEANAALLRLQQSLQEPLDETQSQADTPRGTSTPADRSLSPMDSRSTPQPSPSVAAIAMIAAATSSPRPAERPKLPTQNSSEYSQKPRDLRGSPVPTNPESSLVTTTLQLPPIMAYNPVLGRLESSPKPPPSPGEVSLSAFPIPAPRAMSPASARGPPAYVKDVGGPVRKGSQSSRISAASAFSIPFTMVPDRTGSLLENRVGLPMSSTSHIHMNSIDAIVPKIRE